jgi:hypothetical protein
VEDVTFPVSVMSWSPDPSGNAGVAVNETEDTAPLLNVTLPPLLVRKEFTPCTKFNVVWLALLVPFV